MSNSIVKRVLTHLGLLPIYLVGRLNVRHARRATRWLGWVMEKTLRRRRKIVDQNLAWCFPLLSDTERLGLRRQHFRHLGEAVGEMAVAWTQAKPIDPQHGQVEGLAHIEEITATGQGVLLVTGHNVCLEWAARVFGQACPSSGIYRPLSNPVLERFQNKGRGRYAEHMFDRDDLRGMVRHLRSGKVLWYAPDQDFGPKRSLFVPFFGIETATAKALPELARLGRAKVVPMYPIKNETTGQVVVHIEPAWDDFPSDNPEHDLARFNAFLQRHIEKAPAQYWWLHRRFKTAPDGTARYQL